MQHLSEYGRSKTSDVDVDLDLRPEHIELIDSTAQGGAFEIAIQMSRDKLVALQPL